MNRNFAIELGCANLGEITAGVPAFDIFPASTLSIERYGLDRSVPQCRIGRYGLRQQAGDAGEGDVDAMSIGVIWKF